MGNQSPSGGGNGVEKNMLSDSLYGGIVQLSLRVAVVRVGDLDEAAICELQYLIH